ncbi:MAG: hypothetical protein GXO39_06650 [Thermotogae bacterium]|nr:hypothetical protein [Thermotogota bacterium]
MRRLVLFLPLLFTSLEASTLSWSLYLSERLGSSTMGLGGGISAVYTSTVWDLGMSVSGLQLKEYSTAYYRGPRMGMSPSNSAMPEFLQMDLTLRHRGDGYSVGVHSLLNNDTLASVGFIPFAGIGIYRQENYVEVGTSYSLYFGGPTLSALQVSIGAGRMLRSGVWLDVFALVGQVVGVEALGLRNGTYPSLGTDLRFHFLWGDLHFGGWYGRQLLALKGYGFIAYNLPFVYTDGLFAGVGTKIGGMYVSANVSTEGYLEDENGSRRSLVVGGVTVSFLR